ncbi:MAG: NAD(P)(+) transhydrogenase (Re/Si-specific) subunit beta [Chlamydiota bacterium]|nr:NAD(P)(+) transhydrogenase (Re/Si-specific) subunit beta [Chlamydiota bacterium]
MGGISAVGQLLYLIAASLFIIGLRFLGSPSTARKGNLLASLAMFIAVVVTLLDQRVINYPLIGAGIVIGSVIGIVSALMIKMTAMPQMVGLFNGFGGVASALVSLCEYYRLHQAHAVIGAEVMISILLGVLIGGVTFSGSLVAFAKLQGIMRGSPITFRFQQAVNALLLFIFVALSAYLMVKPNASLALFLIMVLVSIILGVLFVIPIGGADMPVVISFLNAFSGLAACAAGFVVMNKILIVAGSLVGASGIILTQIMCKAMNRSLTNVLFSAFGSEIVGAGSVETQKEGKTVRSIDAEEGAIILAYAQSVIIVPGYGMAAAQAQHAVRDLAMELEKRGVDVKYAIHPVAGRMPGHMNVLLAEANVPYDQLFDMDDVNPLFERTDVSLVIGANDVVNPAARENKSSPIYGMPILDVDKSRHIIIIKRSMNPGFAGIDNDLFYNDHTTMLFGSAKEMVSKLTAEVKQQ